MSENRFVVCLSNEGYPASLEPRKLYEWLDDRKLSPKACCGSSTSPARTTLTRKRFAQVAVPGELAERLHKMAA